MATIKSFTDRSQSKKLADILPLESANMFYYKDAVTKEDNPRVMDYSQVPKNKSMYYFPCWSLAALLEQFEDTAGLARDYGLWFCYDNRKSYCTKHYDNPIDACYEMILKLHELKKL